VPTRATRRTAQPAQVLLFAELQQSGG